MILLKVCASTSYDKCDCGNIKGKEHCNHEGCDLYCAAKERNCPKGTKYHCAKYKQTEKVAKVCAVEKFCGKGKNS